MKYFVIVTAHNVYKQVYFICVLECNQPKCQLSWNIYDKHVSFHFVNSPHSAIEKIWFFGIKSWFFTRNTPNIFAPPSARRNFFKCAPLTWNLDARKCLRYFVWKFTILRQKINFFQILGGARAGCAPLNPPLVSSVNKSILCEHIS
jgi:hypothetical protein